MSLGTRQGLVGCLAASLAAAACNRTVGTDDDAGPGGEASDTIATTGASATSTTGEEGCPESDFPEPYCYKRYDISNALAGESFTVVGTGRFGPDGGPGLLLAQPTSLHFAFWNADAQTLEISLAAEGPEGAQWNGGSHAEQLPAIVRGSSPTHDDVVLVHDGSFWHFPGAAGGLEAPILSTVSYEDDETDWTWRAWKILAVMDLDGDGRSELAMEIGKAVQIWRHEPSGWVPWGPRYPHQFYPAVPGWGPDGWPVCPGTHAAKAADLDGDGREDLVLLNESGCSTTDGYVERPVVAVLRNTNGTPEGLDAGVAHHAIPEYVRFFELGDLDGDGAIDIVVAKNEHVAHECGPGPLRVLRGVGDATFEAPVDLLAEAWGVCGIDLDDDGSVEMILVPFCEDRVGGVYIMDGLESNHSMTRLSTVMTTSIAPIEDINGDGAPDLAPRTLRGQDDKYAIYMSIR